VSLLASYTLLLQETGEHGARLLGIPMWIWQLANLVGFLVALFYLVAKPLTKVFRDRQLAVEERLKQARERREEAARLEAQVHERMGQLEHEIAEIRARGIAEGEAARAELVARAGQEAERVKREAAEEIDRRAATALAGLERAASDLVASAAVELISREITDDDRRRLLEDGVSRLRSEAR
jgi:F-type H+-transporting ATPase subunit b